MAVLEQVRAQGYDEAFIRMWEFYLCYSESGFVEKSISSVQILWAKPANRRQQWLPQAIT
jgi:cyclopropane-fatty-acyl-phospholipid synthase